MVKVSVPSLIYAAVTLAAALAIHALYRLAEHLVRAGRLRRRDYAVIPGLVVIVTVIGAGLEWLDLHNPALLPGAGFGAFLGLNVGRLVPRPPSRLR